MASIAVTSSDDDVQEKKKHGRLFTPLFYFFLWCGCIFSQSMLVSGFLNVVLSTIQVEFQMSSAEAAMFPSNYDISVAVTVLLVAHFGSSHKPRTLGIGMILLATGSLFFSLAHFIYGKDNILEAKDSEKNMYLCDSDSNADSKTDCIDETMGNSGAYALLTVGSILIGLGASPVYTAGTTFCDEIFPPQKVSMYFGISYGIGALSPAIGFILGGVFLGFYKNLGNPPEGLTVDNVNWVGAWWLGFLICALMGYVFGFLLLFFPAQLPECEDVKQKKLELNIQIANTEEGPANEPATPPEAKSQTFIDLLKDMLPLLKSVLLNPVFVVIVLGSITDSLIISAFAAWLPKMVESQFGVSSSVAAYITGGVTVPGAAGGIIVSGLIVKWKKLNGLQCAKWQAYIGIACIIAQLGFLIHCPTVQIDGVNSALNSTCSQAVEDAQCAARCPGNDVYEPICLDGVTYRSPCIAACTEYNANSKEFSNCCGRQDLVVEAGACDTNCKWLIPYVICLFLIMFLTFLNNIFFLTANLRCVKDSERVIAISLQSVSFRVFGSFPGPIILGAFIDKACILWNTNACGEEGACQEYDNTKIMVVAVSIAMIAKIIGTILYFIGWRLWAKREDSASIAYSDEVKGGIVTNTVTVEPEETGEPEKNGDLDKVDLTDVAL
ncbi:hypothetical protein ACHWQZ_G009109 [Mnemiopsis leidyi]